MNKMKSIDSSTLLDDIEDHFRVFAGPGAGKSYWLVQHIKNVIQHSNRLSPASRIACISYTNVAANEILRKLGSSADRVEVSTIHSFLYRNVVKPYLHLLKDEEGESLVNYALVDGHDEHRPSYPKVKQWLKSIAETWLLLQKYKGSKEKLLKHLKELIWYHSEETQEWFWKPRNKSSSRLQDVCKLDNLEAYKFLYWQEGIIDHEDVLYFAYRILDEFPLVCDFLSAKFPYLFVDEFQDTRPVQTQVVEWLANAGTIVGVIGDVEQSIYSFTNAKPKHFKDFSLPGQIDYKIDGNRRSTNQIIELLNRVREDDLVQNGLEEAQGCPVCVYVGEIQKVLASIETTIPQESELTVLTRRNDEANLIRNIIYNIEDDKWDEFEEIDEKRFRFIKHVIAAGEYAQKKDYTLAVKQLVKGIRVRDGELRKPLKFTRKITALQRRGIAVSLLEFIVNDYDQLSAETLLKAYHKFSNVLSETIEGLSLTGVRQGQFKDFAEATRYKSLASTVRLDDDTRNVRTIHKAKGAEFENVLVYFGKKYKQQLNHILRPAENQTEEKRITYVALSRARTRLFISVPELPTNCEAQLKALGLEVIDLTEKPRQPVNPSTC
jgi:DNA helicase-2/ATP-dependent DNA helicase PcrA